MTLEPIDPETAVELYLTDRQSEVTPATIKSHEYRLNQFIHWCGIKTIDNLNDLTGRLLQEYRIWRRNDGSLSPASEKTQMDTIRVFVRWLGTIDAVQTDLFTKVQSPSLADSENVRDVILDTDDATQLLDYLYKYEYASRPHVLITLMWHTMMRTGAIHSLDIEDYFSEDQYLKIVHRPDTETPLKNKNKGERLIALSGDVCEILDDWISVQRPNKLDRHGREPLISTQQGRAAKSTIRREVYKYTQPCVFTGECPHGFEDLDCDAIVSDAAYKCPSSVSPHAIRRGGITHHLNSDVPTEVVSGRANVTQPILDKHYDRRNKREKMEQRRRYLQNI